MFAAISPDAATSRTAVPVEILRRLAFGRPERRAIQAALAPVAVAVELTAPLVQDCVDLDQRVRQSGEW